MNKYKVIGKERDGLYFVLFFVLFFVYIFCDHIYNINNVCSLLFIIPYIIFVCCVSMLFLFLLLYALIICVCYVFGCFFYIFICLQSVYLCMKSDTFIQLV